MDKENVVSIPTIEYYAALKKEILPPAITWMDLEDIHYASGNEPVAKGPVLRHFTPEVTQTVKTLETGSGKAIAKGWGRQEGKFTFSGYRVSVLQDEKFCKLCCTIT